MNNSYWVLVLQKQKQTTKQINKKQKPRKKCRKDKIRILIGIVLSPPPPQKTPPPNNNEQTKTYKELFKKSNATRL